MLLLIIHDVALATSGPFFSELNEMPKLRTGAFTAKFCEECAPADPSCAAVEAVSSAAKSAPLSPSPEARW
jgi:hypothetical protein